MTGRIRASGIILTSVSIPQKTPAASGAPANVAATIPTAQKALTGSMLPR